MKSSGARRALLDAFSELARSRRYADFGVGLIARNARVAKSTFYYHFRQKDDLLVENLRPLIAAAAELPFAPAVTPEIETWVDHLWRHRAVARPLLAGSAGRKLIDGLTEALAGRLAAVAKGDGGRRLALLLAHQIAGALSGLLRGWLSGRVSAQPAEISGLLWSSARSLAGPITGYDAEVAPTRQGFETSP